MRWKCTRVTYRTCRLRKMKTTDRKMWYRYIMHHASVFSNQRRRQCSERTQKQSEHRAQKHGNTERQKRRNAECTETQSAQKHRAFSPTSGANDDNVAQGQNGDLENGSSKMERGGRCTMHHISLLGLRSSPDPGSSLPALPNQQQQNNDTTLQLRAP